MGIIELLLIALGLSMDAFAVSVTDGLCVKNMKLPKMLGIALTFGIFQGAMPAIGYALGQTFTGYIQKFDHIIALVLLCFIGGKLLFDGLKKGQGDHCNVAGITFGALMMQGVATSIDALAVGISFSVMRVNILVSAGFIAAVTFLCSFIGVAVGKKFGSVLNKKAQILGGIILIGIGVKIFVEHTFFAG